eukprot:12460466-Heterocapsa_arctica.AAC.1
MEVHTGLQSCAGEAGGPAAGAPRPVREGNLEASSQAYEGQPSAGADAGHRRRTARRSGQQGDEQPETSS